MGGVSTGIFQMGLTNDFILDIWLWVCIMSKWSRLVPIGTGDWSNGMIGVSKTFGGSSILSSPAE